MNSKYSKDNLIFFKFNGMDYALHKHVIRKMGIFDVINDVKKIDQIEIFYDTTPDVIEFVFDIMSNYDNYDEKKLSIVYIINVISIMRYLSIDANIITSTSRKMLEIIYCKDGYYSGMKSFIEHCKTIKYSTEMKYLLTLINKNHYNNYIYYSHSIDIKELLYDDIINSNHFDFDFRYDVGTIFIKKLIFMEYDIHLSASMIDDNSTRFGDKMYYIGKTYELFNIVINIIKFDVVDNNIVKMTIDDYEIEILESDVIPKEDCDSIDESEMELNDGPLVDITLVIARDVRDILLNIRKK
jgi:hypothetical protein